MQPFVSIILPVRNEEKFIISCLRSIFLQDYPSDRFEIIIIDGRSEDATVDKVNKFKAEPFDIAQGKSSKLKQIRLLKNPKKAVSSSRNIAIQNATGDIVLCMDAHAVYAPDYISSCVEVMEATGAANVGGHMRALPANNTALAQASVLANDSPFGLGGGRFHDPNYEGFVETVWMGCYKKAALDKIGLYDERRTRTEDIDLNRRLVDAGYKIYLSPKIKAWYFPRSKLSDLWRQRWADGYEITHFLPDNPKAPRLRHFIPLIFVASLLLLSALSYSLNRSTGLNCLNQLPELKPISNLFNRPVSFNWLFIRLLLLELLAYFAAMIFFVCQAGRSVQRTAYGKQGIANGEEVKMFDTVGERGAEEAPGFPIKPGMTRRNGPVNSIFNIQNSKFSPGSLALLPLVFLTLHFSYGLGSIWGLISLPLFVNGKLKNR